MKRVAVIVLLSIPAVAGDDKDKVRFSPGPASSYAGHQTMDKITLAAVPFLNEDQVRTAFGKVNPYKYGVLPVLVILENATGKALRLDYLGRIRVIEVLPGLVRTEFDEVRRFGDTATAAAYYASFPERLLPEDIASCVAFALGQPPRVTIAELLVLPSA